MIKRFSQQKYDESKRAEYLDKKQTEEEETMESSCKQDETETGIPGQETGKW